MGLVAQCRGATVSHLLTHMTLHFYGSQFLFLLASKTLRYALMAPSLIEIWTNAWLSSKAMLTWLLDLE